MTHSSTAICYRNASLNNVLVKEKKYNLQREFVTPVRYVNAFSLSPVKKGISLSKPGVTRGCYSGILSRNRNTCSNYTIYLKNETEVGKSADTNSRSCVLWPVY